MVPHLWEQWSFDVRDGQKIPRTDPSRAGPYMGLRVRAFAGLVSGTLVSVGEGGLAEETTCQEQSLGGDELEPASLPPLAGGFRACRRRVPDAFAQSLG